MYFILALLSLVSAWASGPEKCFEQHLSEAITLNKERAGFYSAYTRGRSNKVFHALIAGEMFTLPTAKFFDTKALPYQRKGIPLFCDEFLPMKLESPVLGKIPKEKYQVFNWQGPANQIRKALARDDLSAVKSAALVAVRALETSPSYNCMLRHIFESIFRFAYFVPRHEAMATSNGLMSPRNYSKQVILLHLLSLPGTSVIDALAAPMQAQGFPMICSEVPDLLGDLVL